MRVLSIQVLPIVLALEELVVFELAAGYQTRGYMPPALNLFLTSTVHPTFNDEWWYTRQEGFDMMAEHYPH